MNRKLNFREDGTFTIVQFTDVHWTDGSDEDFKTSALMRLVLEKEKPDLVIFTGDTCAGRDNLNALRHALEPVDEARIPFAIVFGNHDDEEGENKEALLSVQKERPLCLTEAGDPNIGGLCNYTLRIGSRDGNKTEWILYMIDSGTYNENSRVGGYDFIRRNQVNWYIRTSEDIREECGDVPALAFFHVPLPEYNDLWYLRTCYGEKNEQVCCPYQNSGMFSAMLEMGNVKGIFVGHDHINDYYGDLHGIMLYYGRSTGYNTYGMERFAHGARIIRLKENEQGFESWIRLDDGSILEKQAEHLPDPDFLKK